MENLFKQFLKEIGEDPCREGLLRTPKRAAEGYKYLTRGYQQNIKDVVNGAVFNTDSDEMILVKDIEMYSLCEHHLLPFIGKCHVAYIPKNKIIGLSKIPRIVDMFARRLQVQENLTSQVAHTIQQAIDAAGVAVVIEAQHLCMMMRGVEKQNAVMKTSCMLGYFRQSINTRAEFLSLIK
jgi:GTP cyclohydrolase IA